MLEKDKLLESYESVKQFLFDGKKFADGGIIPCVFIEGRQHSVSEIHIEHISHIPSYNLNDDIFKSYGLRNPIWSAHQLLKWDIVNKELIIEVDRYREIRLKRIY